MDLVLAKNAPDLPERFPKPIPGSDDRIPKIVALFGPNASGKTTVLRAIAFLQWFVRSSFDLGVGTGLPFSPFGDKEGWQGITEFSVDFDAQLIEEQPRCVYRYDLSIQNFPGKPQEVILERLKYAPKGKSKRLFERANTELKFGEEFNVGKSDAWRKTVRPNASLVCTFAKFAHPLSMKIVEELSVLQTNLFIRKFDFSEEDATKFYSQFPNLLAQLNKRIQTMDLGIEEIQISLDKDRLRASFRHSGLDYPIDLNQESDGTRNFYSLFPYLSYVLLNGGIAVLDEFDNDIHPLLLPEIVSWFYDPEMNPHNAQLFMSCHNATLLEHLTKEEVFFTEKNKRGETEIYGLKNIRGVRRDTNIYTKYLGGVFGAVPHIG